VRQDGDEFVLPRDLVVGHFAAGPGDQLLGGQGRTGAPDRVRLAHLAEARIGYADDGDLGDVQVSAEELLHLGR
jgi:hypothetical protein